MTLIRSLFTNDNVLDLHRGQACPRWVVTGTNHKPNIPPTARLIRYLLYVGCAQVLDIARKFLDAGTLKADDLGHGRLGSWYLQQQTSRDILAPHTPVRTCG